MRFAAFVAVSLLLAAAAAGAPLPEVSARAPARPLEISLTAVAPEVCVMPPPADALWFASAPTSRLDAQEYAAINIASLIAVQLLALPRLLLLGVPWGAPLSAPARGRCSTR